MVNPAYIATSVETWDEEKMQFTDLRGNGRHGVVTDTVWDEYNNLPGIRTEDVNGYHTGRTLFVATSLYGTILWGVQSIPSTFTICVRMITRSPDDYYDSWIILDCTDKPWYHGHCRGVLVLQQLDLRWIL